MKLELGCFLPAGLLVSFFVWTGDNIFGAEFDNNLAKDFQVKPGGKLIVQADTGSLNISPSASDNVAIRVLRKVKVSNQEKADTVFSDHEVTFKQDGDTVTVTAKNNESTARFFNFNRPSLQVSYQISVPKKFNVDLRTAGGDIHVGDLDGQATTHTSSGAIVLKAVSGNVEAADSGGNITIESAGGGAKVATSSGSIRIGKAGGTVSARNSGGDISVKSANRAIQASTSSGDIDVRFAAQPQASSRLEVAGGGIKLALADGIGANLNARATGGRVVTELPVTVTVLGEPKEGALEGKINEGGADLVLRASSGDIVIKKN